MNNFARKITKNNRNLYVIFFTFYSFFTNFAEKYLKQGVMYGV